MNFNRILCIASLSCAIAAPSHAQKPGSTPSLTAADLKASQADLSSLMAKAAPDDAGKKVISPDGDSLFDFSQYLTEAENKRIAGMLEDPRIFSAITSDQILAAARRRKLDHSLGWFFNCRMVMSHSHDPKLIALYRDALKTDAAEAVNELFLASNYFWDKSLVEPVIEAAERDPGAVERATEILNFHHADWASDASIPPRLSKAVLKSSRILIALKSGTSGRFEGQPPEPLVPQSADSPQPPREGSQNCCNALRALARTHDPSLIPMVRPFLKFNGIAGEGSVRDGVPLRMCDVAAEVIHMLLGDPPVNSIMLTDGIVKIPKVAPPQWKQCDTQIAALEARLNSLPH